MNESNIKTADVAVQCPGEVELLDFLLKARGETRVHGGSSGEDDVLVELGPDINIGRLDGVVKLLSHTDRLNINQLWLEEGLCRLEPLRADLDDTAIRKGVVLDQNSGLMGKLGLELKIVANIAELFLDLPHGLEVSCAVESITTEEEKLDQVAGDITSSNIKATGQMGKSEALIHGDNVGHTITRVNDNTGQKTLRRRRGV
jgi:hypothetical protein